MSLSVFCRVWYCISYRGTVLQRRSCVMRCRWTARHMTCGTVWARCCKLKATTPPQPNASLLPWSWRPAAPSYLSPSFPAPSKTLLLATNKNLGPRVVHEPQPLITHTHKRPTWNFSSILECLSQPSELFICSQMWIWRKRTPIYTVVSVNFSTLLHSRFFPLPSSFLLSLLECPPASVHHSGAAHLKSPLPSVLSLVSFTLLYDWTNEKSVLVVVTVKRVIDAAVSSNHSASFLPKTCPETYNLEILVAVCHTNQ